MLLSKSGLTRLFDRMAQEGLVERIPCPTDRRSTYAGMTVAGRAALEAASPIHGRGVREHFACHLTDDEAACMRAAFTKMLNAIPRAPAIPACLQRGD